MLKVQYIITEEERVIQAKIKRACVLAVILYEQMQDETKLPMVMIDPGQAFP